MDRDKAREVLEKAPVLILARHYSVMVQPSQREIMKAEKACEKLVEAGYTIVRIEDYE